MCNERIPRRARKSAFLGNLFILHIVSLRNSLELIYLTEEKMYGSISNKAVF